MSITLEEIKDYLTAKNVPSAILEDHQKVAVAFAANQYTSKNDIKALLVTVEPDGEKVKIQAPNAFYLEEAHLHSFVGVLEAHIDPRKIDVIDLEYIRETKALHFSIKPAIIAQLPWSPDTLVGLIVILHGILDEHYPVLEEATHGCTCEPITLVSREMLEALAASLE